ncbi:MAG: hypothetical protein NW206_00805 [Hyphomonadaceae bacterium]|nr:hypothetical protein [Hyphomonadaceae bacterium]
MNALAASLASALALCAFAWSLMALAPDAGLWHDAFVIQHARIIFG